MEDYSATVEDLTEAGYWDETWMDAHKREQFAMEADEVDLIDPDWRAQIAQDQKVAEFERDLFDYSVDLEDLIAWYGHLGWVDDHGPTAAGMSVYYAATGKLP